MNRTYLLSVLVIATVLCTEVRADRFSIGASVGTASIDAGVIHGTYVDPTEMSEKTDFLRLSGAYDLNRYIAVEGSVYQFAEFESGLEIADSAPIFPGHYSSRYKVELRTWTLGLTASWPISERFRLRAGGSATLNYSSVELWGGRYGGFEDQSNGVVGFEAHAGMDFAVTKNLTLGIRASYLDLGTNLGTSEKATCTTAEFSIGFRF
jgi:opacity protein-like surface antigen